MAQRNLTSIKEIAENEKFCHYSNMTYVSCWGWWRWTDEE